MVPCHSLYIYVTWRSKVKKWGEKLQRIGAVSMGTGVST